MKAPLIAAVCLGIALLTYFQFPGHTWLQQDSQIYAPILERLKDPSVLRNEILAAKPHVAYTLYDEAALALVWVSGAGFQKVLAFEQIVTRAFGVWGLYLMALALIRCGLVGRGETGAGAAERDGRESALALFVAALCSLGVTIVGPTVLTFEYEPTPRAFALPLVIAAIGLLAHRRFLGAGLAGAAAFLYHPPTALPFCTLFSMLALWPLRSETVRSRLWRLGPILTAIAILPIAARAQQGGGEAQTFLRSLTPDMEKLLRLRAPYNWVSEAGIWKTAVFWHYGIVFAALVAAFVRVRQSIEFELRVFFIGLPILGMMSMPASWLLLERWHWALVPQYQPMRMLLYVTFFMQFLAAAAGLAGARRKWPFESIAWFAVAYWPVLQPVVTEKTSLQKVAVAAGLAVLAWIAVWLSGAGPQSASGTASQPASGAGSRPALAKLQLIRQPVWVVLGLAASFAIPTLGGIVNYQVVGSQDLDELATWARAATGKDAVFHFADAGKSAEPGIFRAHALRAVYVDWKGGGQVNYLPGFAEQWWFRWQQTNQNRFKPRDLPRLAAIGIQYIVVQPKNRLPGRTPVFQSAKYLAYAIP